MATLTTADQTTIAYTDHGGTGPAVLLVHGITECAQCWDPVVELLRPDHRVVTMDLRGHGASGTADRYDLEAMAGDVVAVLQELDLIGTAHIVGHSLGGVVVSAVGAAVDVASIVNVDQGLQLGAFKAQLAEVEPMLRDPDSFPAVIEGLFAQMAGTVISTDDMARVNALRRADQNVVLGVWELIFSMSEAEIEDVVSSALAGFAGRSIPYLSLFGIDPGPEYGDWLSGFISGATVELWADNGHYPHLVDPARFVERLRTFWG